MIINITKCGQVGQENKNSYYLRCGKGESFSKMRDV